MHCVFWSDEANVYALLQLLVDYCSVLCENSASVGVRHIRIQRASDNDFFLAECRHFSSIIVSCFRHIGGVAHDHVTSTVARWISTELLPLYIL